MPTEAGPGAAPSGDGGKVAVVRAALQELGLTAAEADQRLQTLDLEQPVETLVRQALSRRP
jgi:RuvA, C-terminal domain